MRLEGLGSSPPSALPFDLKQRPKVNGALAGFCCFLFLCFFFGCVYRHSTLDDELSSGSLFFWLVGLLPPPPNRSAVSF